MEDLGAHAQCFGEGGSAHGHDHELLQVDVVVGVGSPVEDIHHGDGEHAGPVASEVPVQRQAGRLRRRAGHRQRHAENGVGADDVLVVRTVEFDHGAVHPGQVGSVPAAQRRGDFIVDAGDGAEHAFAEVARTVAVTALVRLVGARRSARRDNRPPEGAAGQPHLGLDRGVPPGIQDLSTSNGNDICHAVTFRVAVRTQFTASTAPYVNGSGPCVKDKKESVTATVLQASEVP